MKCSARLFGDCEALCRVAVPAEHLIRVAIGAGLELRRHLGAMTLNEVRRVDDGRPEPS